MTTITDKKVHDELIRLRARAAENIADKVYFQIEDVQLTAYQIGVDVHYRDHNLVNTVQANVDNDQLSDAEFRDFVRVCVAGRKAN